jgi:hypothetical protein
VPPGHEMSMELAKEENDHSGSSEEEEEVT